MNCLRLYEYFEIGKTKIFIVISAMQKNGLILTFLFIINHKIEFKLQRFDSTWPDESLIFKNVVFKQANRQLAIQLENINTDY